MNSIIVTGAGRGLGRAISAGLIADGYHVLAVDLDPASLESLETEFPQKIEASVLDVSNYSQVEQLFCKLKGRSFQGLVNNAGIYSGKGILDYAAQEIDQVIDVNLKGAIYFSRFFAGLMISQQREGSIVNLSSSSIYGGGDPVYSASKAALVGLTKACAKTFSPYLRVNAVAPGIVETDLFQSIPADVVESYRSAELVKRPLEAEDVANTIRFLFSEAGKNYSGAVFDLNNGVHM